MQTITTTTTPRAWVGCLGCYNNGQLNGQWLEGIEADNNAGETCTLCGSDELWVFDHENYAGAIFGECSPFEAAAIARVLADMEEAGLDVEIVSAYASNCGLMLGDFENWKSEFEDSFQGTWDSFREFSDYMVEETLDLGDSTLSRYFDYEAFARDLSYDYFTEDLHNGDVAIFRNL